jgi:hypothetical protein
MRLKTTPPPANDIFIYAMGGGFGHLTRAVALTRAIAGAARVRILTNSPYAPRVAAAMPTVELVRNLDLDGSTHLVVDTFPRGILGELVDVLPRFRGRKILVSRDLNPKYVAAYDLPAFIERFYNLVLDPETSPWFVRSAHEILPRDQARAVLGLQSSAPCVLVCPAGNPDEYVWYRDVAEALAGGCEVRLLAHWPAMELYAAADVVVGGAGYHTVNECVACGVPLVARPWPRQYDRQELRARKAARVVRDVDQAVAAVHELAAMRSSEGRVIAYDNGVLRAAAQLLHPFAANDIQGT